MTRLKGMCKKRLNEEKGVALIMTLLFIVVLLIFGSIFVQRTISEWYTANRERRLVQSFYLAEGGAHQALETLDRIINTNMNDTINNTNPSTVINLTQAHVVSGDGVGFLITTAEDAGVAQFTLSGTDAAHIVGQTAFGAGTYQFTITVSEKANPVAVAGSQDEWDFAYFYRIESTGQVAAMVRKILLVGDFTVRVKRDNFAKYALFTNQQTLPGGTRVWFTDKTNFAGPIHTNDRYNIALNPSGIFDGVVSQYQDTARYYNQGFPVLLDADFNADKDVPTFNSSFDRGMPQIALSSPTQQQDIIDQAVAGSSISGNGIYIPNDGTELTGGIYVEGDATVDMSVDGSDNAVYTIVQGGTTKIITVDLAGDQTSVDTVGVGVSTYTGLPDGVDSVGTLIYVNGEIGSLKGAVQKDTEITISSQDDIKITDHLVYSQYSPAVGVPGGVGYVPPDADGEGNLLGIVTWNGDVRITTAAPDDIDIHGTILARNGIFQVDSYNDTGVGPRGVATLLGGVISDFYGAFGLFNGSTGQQTAGYGRNFVYDGRMLTTNPPYFPSLDAFIANAPDIADKITLQEGGF